MKLRLGRVVVLLVVLRRDSLSSDETAFRCDAEGKTVSPCTICLVPYDYQKPLVCFPAGPKKEVASGEYNIRASASGRALGTNSTLRVTNGQGGGLGGIALDLIPGSELYIPRGQLPTSSALQLLSLESGRIDTLFLSREQETPFPAGHAVAIAIAGPNQPLGITRPWTQPVGGRFPLPAFSEPKKGHGHVVVRAEAEFGWDELARRDVALFLDSHGKKIVAAAASNAAPSHYSIFYDVPAGTYTVKIESRNWGLAPTQVEVGAGKLTLVEGAKLLEKPSLGVEVAPVPWRPSEGWLFTAYSCPDGEISSALLNWPDFAHCKMARRVQVLENSATLVGLDPIQYFLVLEGGGQRLGKAADLSDGKSSKVVFEFRPTTVHGTVRRGGEAVAAQISFEPIWPPDKPLATSTGSDGSYTQTFWSKGLYKVRARPEDQPPERGLQTNVNLDGDADQRLDFEIPATDIRLVVVDKGTLDPIPGASVGWVESGSARKHRTDETGEALLPPLPPGPFDFKVAAEGYKAERQSVQVMDVAEPQRFEVALARQREENSFTVLLPGGSPAPNASAFVCDQAGLVVVEASSCDATGVCRLSTKPSNDQPVFVFDPQAGLTVVGSGDLLAAGSVTLKPSGGELSIPVRRGHATDGQTLLLAVALDGIRVPETILAMTANRLDRSYRIYLPAHSSTGAFLLQGLPQGLGTCVVLARPENASTSAAFARATESMSWQLPMQDSAPVDLP